MTGAALPSPPGVDDELERQWAFLAGPGATLTGAERVAVAAAARNARRTQDLDGDGSPLHRAARRMAVAAHTIDRAMFDGLAADGVDAHRYVEVLGIVARTTAADTAVRGLGLPERPLPEPVAGQPTGEIDDEAKARAAFVPTVGPANPVTILNSLPAETAHQEALSNVLYLSYEQMMDFDITRDLHRTQIELVAGRTSSVNECVY